MKGSKKEKLKIMMKLSPIIVSLLDTDLISLI